MQKEGVDKYMIKLYNRSEDRGGRVREISKSVLIKRSA
jgi:hypothetical protein